MEQKLYVNGILLGGSKSDYYHIIDRDYNIGSGFGWKSNTRMNFKNFGNFILNVEYYRLWTWKGFEKKDIEAPDFNPLFLNAQGDKSNAQSARHRSCGRDKGWERMEYYHSWGVLQPSDALCLSPE